MGQVRTDAELRTAATRIHVYTYRYDTPSRQTRRPGRDLLAVCANPARHAAGVYQGADGASRLLPLGGMMIVPAGASIEASGPGGERRLAVCTVAKGLLPADFDASDPRQLALCGDIRDLRVGQAMQRMTAEALAPGFAADLLIDALASGLVVDLARYFRRAVPVPRAEGGVLAPWQLRRVEELVAGSCHRLRIADLAAAVEVSTGHFARSFRNTTGRTVHAYVEEARLSRAQALLRESRLPIKQVAATLGFSGPSSFTLAFRRAVGTTPARYRAEVSRA